MVSLESTVAIPKEVLVCDLEEEAVALNLQTGVYFGLTGTAVRMWSLTAEHGRLDLVFHALLEEFDVPETQLREDLLGFINELVRHGLVIVNSK